jgi:hypothetical protein
MATYQSNNKVFINSNGKILISDPNAIDPVAMAEGHINRVLADGGVIPNEQRVFDACRAIIPFYGSLKTIIDPHIFGYKLQAGSENLLEKQYSLISNTGLVNGAGWLMKYDEVNKSCYSGYNAGIDGVSSMVSPHRADMNITQNIDIDVKIRFKSNGQAQGFISKVGGTAPFRQWVFRAGTDNRMVFQFWDDAQAAYTATNSTGIVLQHNSVYQLRITREYSTGQIKFFFLNNGVWQQSGSTTTISASVNKNILVSETPLRIGAQTVSGFNFSGDIFYAQLFNGFRESGGTLVSRFDASDFKKINPLNNSGFQSTTTLDFWNPNTTGTSVGATGLKGWMIDRNTVQYNGTSQRMWTNNIGIQQPNTVYLVQTSITRGANMGNRVFFDGTQATAKFYWDDENAARANINAGTEQIFIYDSNNVRRRQLNTVVFNNGSTAARVNNNLLFLGNAGTNNMGGISIGGSKDNTEFLNQFQTTLIATDRADNSFQMGLVNSFINQVNGRLW